MNDPKTRIMMLAAAAMTGPLLAWPVVTARWLRRPRRPARVSAVRCHSSWMRLTR